MNDHDLIWNIIGGYQLYHEQNLPQKLNGALKIATTCLHAMIKNKYNLTILFWNI